MARRLGLVRFCRFREDWLIGIISMGIILSCLILEAIRVVQIAQRVRSDKGS